MGQSLLQNGLFQRGKVNRTSGLSLASAIKFAITSHPDVLASKSERQRVESNVSIAEAARYPRIGFGITSGGVQERHSQVDANVGINGEWTLYDFGKTSANISAAKYQFAGASAELDMSVEAVAEQTAVTFLDLLRAEAHLDAINRYVSSLEKTRQIIVDRADSGVSDRADVVTADVELDNAKALLASAKAKRSGLRSSLSEFTGQQISELKSADPLIATIEKRISSLKLDDNPEITAARQTTSASQQEVIAQKAAVYPEIGIEGHYGVSPFNGFNGAGSIMLTLKGNIYQGGAQNARIKAAVESERAAQLRTNSIRLSKRNKLQLAIDNETGARERAALAKNQTRNAARSRDIYFEQYKLGKRNLIELLNAERQISDASILEIDARYDRLGSIVTQIAAYGALVKLTQ